MNKIKTVFDNNFKIHESDKDFKYQELLTKKLDKYESNLDQSIINEIVLWKVNRYVSIDADTLELLNKIDSKSNEIDIEQTNEILIALLQTKGIQLPMASTILRFRNNKIYQIIDQRVYRIIYENKKLKLSSYQSKNNLKHQIELYLQYLIDLKNICIKLNIDFHDSDRILYKADKRINFDIQLDNYSTLKNSVNELI